MKIRIIVIQDSFGTLVFFPLRSSAEIPVQLVLPFICCLTSSCAHVDAVVFPCRALV